MKLLLPTLLAATLLAPAAARAETVVADPTAWHVTALGGTIVWGTGYAPAKLMQRSPDGTVAPVAGTAEAYDFRNPDLGRDAQNRLVLTYSHCATLTSCTYVRNDLAGNTTTFKGLAPKDCTLSTAPAVWKSSVAYGLSCVKRVKGKRVGDPARSGLYLKRKGERAIRFSTPKKARRSGAWWVEDVDLRGSRIGALYGDISMFATVQTTSGDLRRTVRVATTEGDGDQRAAGVTIGTGDVRLWSLTRSYHQESPAQTIIHRIAEDCDDYQVLTADAGAAPEDFPLVDLTADGGTLYAVDRGVGIVTHDYARTAGC